MSAIRYVGIFAAASREAASREATVGFSVLSAVAKAERTKTEQAPDIHVDNIDVSGCDHFCFQSRLRG